MLSLCRLVLGRKAALKLRRSLLQNRARRERKLRFTIVVVGLSKTFAIATRVSVGGLHRGLQRVVST